ncbi:MAG TPA: hypothetical protein DET40_14810 [Lentisphaeria bacterium]|nr:MAG: hypothetical protein A2X45_06090 [Lentisphaerae bacterium GWF2_50_93]HCE44809.1 hypothetical protein [Lentisphaeria bacterium]
MGGASGKIRILLAEDSLLGRKLALKMIEHCGHEADYAENGKEAVDKSCANAYDLILMDMYMPELNGGDAALEISRKGVLAPIIALSGDVIGAEELARYSMRDSIVKPLSENELKRVIAAHCSVKDESAPAKCVESSSSSSSGIIFDEKAALEFACGSEDTLAEMISIYLEGTGRNIEILSASIDTGDMQKAKSASHLIKGESKSLGAMKIFTGASEINDAAKAGDRERCASMMHSLRNDFKEFITHIGRTGKT